MLILGICFVLCGSALLISACWISHYLLVMQPELQIKSIERFAYMAVNEVKLTYPVNNDGDQKILAMHRLRAIFREFSIIMPHDTLIETAVNSALFRFIQEEAIVRLEELRAEIEHDRLYQPIALPEIPLSYLPSTPYQGEYP